MLLLTGSDDDVETIFKLWEIQEHEKLELVLVKKFSVSENWIREIKLL